MSSSARILLALATVTAGAMIGVSSAAASAVRADSHRATICKSNGFLMVRTRHLSTRYAIRDAYWLGQRPQCISNRGQYSNFQVVQRPGYDPAGRVVAYPDIFRGCIWNICTPAAALPRPVSTVGRPEATWHTSEHAAGTWNAAFDIWFGKKRMVTGQANGAELMIWLNEHGGCCALQPGAPRVWVAGSWWLLSHWTAQHNGVSWNYIQFRRVHRTWQVNNLRLYPFIRRVEHLGLVRSSWWLENIEAGFELWSGGQGLATTEYIVRNVPRRA
jgi:Glycosyl hydrolase family 12